MGWSNHLANPTAKYEEVELTPSSSLKHEDSDEKDDASGCDKVVRKQQGIFQAGALQKFQTRD